MISLRNGEIATAVPAIQKVAQNSNLTALSINRPLPSASCLFHMRQKFVMPIHDPNARSVFELEAFHESLVQGVEIQPSNVSKLHGPDVEALYEPAFALCKLLSHMRQKFVKPVHGPNAVRRAVLGWIRDDSYFVGGPPKCAFHET